MPAGDHTGPRGMGPMSGRGAGYCAGCDVPGYAHPFAGRGMRMGRGGGFGHGFRWRNIYHATGLPFWARPGFGFAPPPMTKEQELEVLKELADWLKEHLEAINQRIAEIE